MVAARTKELNPKYRENAKKRQLATQLAGRDKEGNFIISATPPVAEPKGETNEIVGNIFGQAKKQLNM